MTVGVFGTIGLGVGVWIMSMGAVAIGVAAHEACHYAAARLLGCPAWFERDGRAVYTVFDVPVSQRWKGNVIAVAPFMVGLSGLGVWLLGPSTPWTIWSVPIWAFFLTVVLPIGGDLPFEDANADNPAGA